MSGVEEHDSSGRPVCPDCDGPMTLRTARRGRNAGGLFWGCDDYPRCKGTRDHEGAGVNVDSINGTPALSDVDAGPAPNLP